MEVMGLIDPDVYITFAVLTAIVFTFVAMRAINKQGELEGGVIIAIPSVAIVVGSIWPVAYLAGGFVAVCYIFSYLVKKVS